MSLHHCFGDHVIGNCKAAPNPEVRLTGSQGVELARRYDLDVNPVVTMKVCQARHQPGGSEAVAKRLTFPEIVTPFNLKEMKELVMNGPDILPDRKSKRLNSSH